MRAALIAAVAFTACETLPLDVAECLLSPAKRPGPLSLADVGVVGRPVGIELVVNTQQLCDGGFLHATAVHTEVFDTDNVRVEHTATFPHTGDDGRVTTQVVFISKMAGPHHVLAVFEPNLGSAQRDVFTARDQTDLPQLAGVRVKRDLASGCLDYALTDHDTVVCRRISDVLVVRGDQQVQTIDASGPFAVDHDTLWVVNALNLERFQDTGSGPLAFTIATSLSHVPLTLVAEADSVIIVTWERAERWHYRPATPTVAESLLPITQWQLRGLNLGLSMVASARGDALVVATSRQLCRANAADGSTTCENKATGPAATGADGLWLRRQPDGVQRITPGTPGFELDGAGEAFGWGPMSGGWGNRPLMVNLLGTGRVLAPSLDATAVLVDWSQSAGRVLEVQDDWAVVAELPSGDSTFVRAR